MIILLLLVRATYVLFFAHIPFVVNHTFNATPAEWLQQLHKVGVKQNNICRHVTGAEGEYFSCNETVYTYPLFKTHKVRHEYQPSVYFALVAMFRRLLSERITLEF